MHPLETYASELRDLHSSGHATKETSYYPALRDLLNEVGKGLKPKVRCIVNLRDLGAGLPDGGLFTPEQFPRGDANPTNPASPARGVIEVKSTRDDAWVTADGAQVTRYWNKYGQVLVTNYRDFVLVGRDAVGQSVKLESFRLADGERAFRSACAHPFNGRARARRTPYYFLSSSILSTSFSVSVISALFSPSLSAFRQIAPGY